MHFVLGDERIPGERGRSVGVLCDLRSCSFILVACGFRLHSVDVRSDSFEMLAQFVDVGDFRKALLLSLERFHFLLIFRVVRTILSRQWH